VIETEHAFMALTSPPQTMPYEAEIKNNHKPRGSALSENNAVLKFIEGDVM
jgi:hypothetical protein